MNYRFVACDRCKVNQADSLPISKSSREFGFGLDMFCENQIGLGVQYASMLQGLRAQGCQDVVVLMHSDAELTQEDWRKRLDDAFLKYDIVGVAGSKCFRFQHPATWFNAERVWWSGGISHPDMPVDYFGPPTRVAVLDGVFMAINLARVTALTFRVDFGFHHYDLAFCADAVISGIKVGTADLLVKHHSRGNFGSPEFIASSRHFLDVYGRNKVLSV